MMLNQRPFPGQWECLINLQVYSDQICTKIQKTFSRVLRVEDLEKEQKEGLIKEQKEDLRKEQKEDLRKGLEND